MGGMRIHMGRMRIRMRPHAEPHDMSGMQSLMLIRVHSCISHDTPTDPYATHPEALKRKISAKKIKS
eukprot:NODE_2715_length_407_cov_7.653631_g2634_i0.p2 GENE.NODE_2715_length_407_cov_7.653631_g2634_i0~~NODE_2715_length_407_cov_7.653631_g2634_i0.p2  ORF type:complete len:67 (+),score=4.24 NODE_2715_length_407_cov_7.653631_g2634_i0:139-339(+)